MRASDSASPICLRLSPPGYGRGAFLSTALVALLLIASDLLLACVPAFAHTIERVSVASDGTPGNDSSGVHGLSSTADGRFVAFCSTARNLVPGDANGSRDVFVHDRVTGVTERVSVASDGTQGNEDSGYGMVASGLAISANGRFVAFVSNASNLVPGDTNGYPDVFVHDRMTGQTERVSVASDGSQGQGGRSENPSISADGRFVAFGSQASNLAPGGASGSYDVFVHDRATGVTERVSVASDGSQGNSGSGVYGLSISADGRVVAFESGASNLVPGDTNGGMDVFVHDRATGLTERVSVASDGAQAQGHSSLPSVSADGRFVAFKAIAYNLVPAGTGWPAVYVHDRATGITERVSVASDGSASDSMSASNGLSISADGRFVAFDSYVADLVSGDTNGQDDVFVHDRATGLTERVSVASDGTEGDRDSGLARISGDGRFVAFESEASNLVPQDTGGWTDVFVATTDMPVTPLSTLSSAYVTPATGDTLTKFTWRVKYWNAADVAPTSIQVAIWSAATKTTTWSPMWAFDPSDANYMDGRWYTYSATLSAGSYACRFAAQFGDQWVYWPLPAGTYQSGPTVAQGNPVALAAGYVTPTTGASTTNFTWRVKYWNSLNAAPDEIKVAIWFPTLKTTYWYTMYPLDPSDAKYSNGAVYQYSRKWLPPGTYAYRFAARQGTNWAYWPSPAGTYASGPTVSPL